MLGEASVNVCHGVVMLFTYCPIDETFYEGEHEILLIRVSFL